MRRAAKVDGNHAEIASAARQMGCSVLSLAAVGKGCPDLLLARSGRVYLVEVKNGENVPSRRRLTPDQVEFHQQFPVVVVESVEDLVRMFSPLAEAQRDMESTPF